MEELAPIVLFVYNRPELTKQTLFYLQQNYIASKSDLFIFSDGPKNDSQIEKVNNVRKILNSVSGFNKVNIITSDINKGLANSVISGVSQVLEKYGRAIVVEDDLITSRYFLNYMNDALNYYEQDKNIWSISGYTPNIKFPDKYSFDIYIAPRGCSWGWATWKNRWEKIDWDVKNYAEFRKDKNFRKKFNMVGNELAPMLDDQMKGNIDSWAIRWYFSQFNNNAYTIFPRNSFVVNEGFKGEGTHGSISNRYETIITETYNINFVTVPIDNTLLVEFSKFFNLNIINYFGRFLKKVGLFRPAKKLYKIMFH